MGYTVGTFEKTASEAWQRNEKTAEIRGWEYKGHSSSAGNGT